MDLREMKDAGARRHPWEIARAHALRRILTGIEIGPRGAVLDVGCGDGYAAKAATLGLAPCTVFGVDPSFTDEQIRAVSRAWPGMELVRRLDDVPRAAFDLALLLDVLEHVDDDRAFLADVVSRFVKPGGHVLVTAPAFPSLWSGHDAFLGHRRRYDLRGLLDVMEGAGLATERHGYLFASLLPARALSRVLEGLRGARTGSDLAFAASRLGWTARAFELTWRIENRLLLGLRGLDITVPGLTVWALCTKRPSSSPATTRRPAWTRRRSSARSRKGPGSNSSS
ncbi:MAG: class I SAM-dependent methyltransferase [Deltaproteobacteria bacterium]|nr:class I SAM-dependent methyltransferase [Deltaproteobacteria bacterium]